MTELRDILYAPEHGDRGRGDLYLPRAPRGAPAALTIHGGGWQSMDKSRMAPVAALLAEEGWAAFAVNYRLINHAPWPACMEDCIAAARFLLSADVPALEALDRRALLVLGASAGGHLALMTGLRLPRRDVLGILSIAGPADLELLARQKALGEFPLAFWRRFFGPGVEPAPETFASASPVHCVPPAPPPLLCVHSARDQLVPIGHSERLVNLWRRNGGRAELSRFDGRDSAHGLWQEGTPLRLTPEAAGPLARFVRDLRRETSCEQLTG